MNVSTSKTARHRGLWIAIPLLIGLTEWLVLHWPRGGLWYDEALTTYVATDSWATLWRWCTQVDIQVPLHYVVLRLWVGLLGDSEFALRLLSVFCAILTVAATVAIGRRVAPKTGVGVIAGLLLGILPGMLWIGFEVRAYALALALYAWATVFLLKVIARNEDMSSKHNGLILIIYCLLILATLYTHYTGLAAFAAHLLILGGMALAKRSWPLLRTTIIILVLVGIGFAPWLPTLLTRGGADKSYYVGQPIPPLRAAEVMIGFKALSRDDAPDVAMPLIIGYAVLMIGGLLAGIHGRRWRALLVGVAITLIPMAITAALVYFKPKLAGRYAWPAWLGIDLLADLAIAAFLTARVRILRIGAIFGTVFILSAPYTLATPGGPPESDFRGAFAYLCTHGTPDDVILLRDGTLFVAEHYYGRRAPCTTPRQTIIGMPAAEITNVDQYLSLPDAKSALNTIIIKPPPNVWVLAWQGDIMDPQGLAYAFLDGTGQHETRMFGDVRLDWYAYPQPVGDPVALATVKAVNTLPGGPALQRIRLIAPDIVHIGDTLVIQSWWSRGDTLLPNLRVSPRLTTLDGGWTYSNQLDQPPAGWKYVDDRWQIGIPTLGRYELFVGDDVPSGKIAVRLVLYDANVPSAPLANFVIGEITVQKNG